MAPAARKRRASLVDIHATVATCTAEKDTPRA
jgi:hypothetical protein